MNIRIDRPTLNKGNADKNIAVVDKWIADTSDKLNIFIKETNREDTQLENSIAESVVYIDKITTILEQYASRINELEGRVQALEEGETT